MDETTLTIRDTAFAGLQERRPVLLVRTRDGVRAVPMSAGQELVVGRSPDVSVPVEDAKLSRRHAAFRLEGEQVWVEDLGSTNGTWIGSAPVRGSTVLPAGATVQLGQVRISVEGLDAWEMHLRTLATHAQFEQSVAEAWSSGTVAVLAIKATTPTGPPESWSREVREALRLSDLLALYGGQTFEALLPDADAATATVVARTMIRRAPRALGLRCGIAVSRETTTRHDALVTDALQALQRASAESPIALARPQARASAAVVEDPHSRELWAMIERVATTRAPVLVLGETGTGKEVIARAVHDGSGREGPFQAVNCGAIPPTLLESTLFGHVRGAFTGANRDRGGLFREAHGGTLFLDEIGELPPSAQVALLRVLETSSVRAVGAEQEVKVDVRVVAATHRDLRRMCDEGTFRTDLLYRLEVLSLQVPPLRQRPLDVLPLAEHFLHQARSLHGSRARYLCPEVRDALLVYAWPGNVRELRNVVERAAVLCSGDSIGLDDLPERLRRRCCAPNTSPHPLVREATEEVSLPVAGLTLKEHVQRLEAALIRRALACCRQNQTEAARLLDMPRRTLVYKLTNIGVEASADECDRDELLLMLLEHPDDDGLDHRSRLEQLEKRVLARALRTGSTDAVAERLGIHPRTLASKLRRYGLDGDP